MPDGQVRVVVLCHVGWWPPHLVVGRGQYLPQLDAGQGAADRHMDVGSEPPLWLDGGVILEVMAEEAAQVLDEPVVGSSPARRARSLNRQVRASSDARIEIIAGGRSRPCARRVPDAAELS